MRELPVDIIMSEILCRLPVHALVRYKWVCKSWFNLITNHDFIKRHYLLATRDDDQIRNRTLVLNTDGNVIYSRKYHDMFPASSSSTLNNKPAFMVSVNHPFGHNFVILGSFRGLMYLRSEARFFSRQAYFIFNPSTTEFNKLPNYSRLWNVPRGSSTVHGFGYDHSIDDYKVVEIGHIVRRSDGNVTVTSRINIYTLGSNSWTTKLEAINPVLQAHIPISTIVSTTEPGVFVNGSLHWLIRRARISVLCFDIVNELEHRKIELPRIITEEYAHLYTTLQEINECLCIAAMQWGSQNTHLWIMKDYGVEESWTKLFTIKGKSLEKEVSRLGDQEWYSGNLEVLEYYREDGAVLMLFQSKYLITYYPGNNKTTIEKTLTKIRKPGICGKSYIESLISVNSGMYLTDAGPTKTIPYIQGTKRGEVKSKIQHLKRVGRFGFLGQIVK